MDAASPAKEKHPRGLYLLFGVEMWERFSYYGMRALLVLFLTSAAGGFGWSKGKANTYYYWYTSLVYFTPLLGGYLADRVLGTHRALVMGAIAIATGHFCLAFHNQSSFFLGLLFIILGTGLFKSNISTMVGQLYSMEDRRREGAFTIFYMGINAGAFFGPLACGYLAEDPRFGWHYGFTAAGIGMVFSLATYLSFRGKYLAGIGNAPPARPKEGIAIVPLTAEDKRGIAVIAILAFFNIFFWMAFEQAGSTMTFFAAEQTRREFLGFNFRATYFQSVNPLAILALSPLFAMMWTGLIKRGRNPSLPVKFAMGLFLLSAGFVVMVMAARVSAATGRISAWWLVTAYALHTLGELCLSPVGLSMVTKLSPIRFASLMMGIWFFSSFLSQQLAGLIAGSVEKIEKGQVFRLLGGQADFFLIFVVSTALAGVVLLALSPKIKRLIAGRA